MSDEPRPFPVYMTPAEVARMLRMSPRTVEKMRLEGRGPRYYRMGPSGRSKVLYRLADVEEWMQQYLKPS